MCSELFPNTTMDVTVSSQDLPPPTFHLARHIFIHSGLRVVHISILCYSQKNYCIIKWLWNVNFQWAIWEYDNLYNFLISISLNFKIGIGNQVLWIASQPTRETVLQLLLELDLSSTMDEFCWDVTKHQNSMYLYSNSVLKSTSKLCYITLT